MMYNNALNSKFSLEFITLNLCRIFNLPLSLKHNNALAYYLHK